ncbi:MAG: hypothetical protein NWQ74_07885 [Opitutales bacterium]|jgi:hypothetical protein|nr:hypothetical protein [Opitutales bacterium]MDP4659300.1 hypothetical protein [Opitutales bacterium]MDP4774811.1 hypothetical protein [Opitutales bacterium]MDP4787221.1 hypothetical protein [Opitutales bacterium]MDP4860776.1 hypothetical protein [Opitutales bacterium]
MQNFASQCLDQTKALLKLNFNSLAPDGTVVPVDGEVSRADEPGHAALAFGEYFRATGDLSLDRQNIAEIVAKTITAQVRVSQGSDNGMAFACLGLLAFGPTRERNPVWELLDESTRALIDERLAVEHDHHDHVQAFDIAKAVCRFSFGLTKKDETGALVDRFMDRITAASTGGFHDEASKAANPDNFGGAFDLYGVVSLIFIRQSLQLHANIQVRDDKLPRLRGLAEKYLRVIMDTVREDGLGWSYGRGIGAYGQMHCITLLLQALRDRWVPVDKEPLARDLVRRLYAHFFTTFFDAEHGAIVIRDGERDTIPGHTTRMANFDAARYLSQWSRLAKTIGGSMDVFKPASRLPVCRFFSYDKSPRKEQGLLSYQDPASGLHVILPLVSSGSHRFSDSLAFPHMPGVFDWPSNQATTPFIPEFTIGGKVFTPSFYGKNAQVAMGTKAGTYHFRYEQPDLVDGDEKISANIASLKVDWEFNGGRIIGRFTLTAKAAVVLEDFRLVLPIAATHSRMTPGNALVLGAESHRCEVLKDDFHAAWAETKVVSDNPKHRTCWGKVHFYQTLQRDKPMPLRAGMSYAFEIAYQPHIVRAGDAV